MIKATITSKGQVTIPKIVRLALQLHAGDRVEFVLHGAQEAALKPVTRSVDEVFGRLQKPHQKPLSTEQMSAAIARRMRRQRR